MKQRGRRYWLIGGIIGIITIVLLEAIGLIFKFGYWDVFDYVFYPTYLLASLILKINFSFVCIGTAMFITLVGIVVESFIIGALVGWAYGKFR